MYGYDGAYKCYDEAYEDKIAFSLFPRFSTPSQQCESLMCLVVCVSALAFFVTSFSRVHSSPQRWSIGHPFSLLADSRRYNYPSADPANGDLFYCVPYTIYAWR